MALLHLGDVVYDFGEATYDYNKFYDPFRNYPDPIFATPGNHDSSIVPGELRNFRISAKVGAKAEV